VFLPYTEATYASTQAWLRERGLFGDESVVPDYAAAVVA
jgi:hypothetical protein